MTDTQKPKYQILKEYIINTIESDELKPGDKISSENELAEKFMISRHTVRQAIGELANEGWLYRIHGKGTFVGDKLDPRGEEPKTIGIMTTYLNDYIFPSIILGIDGVLSQEGYNMVLSCTYNQHDKERICLENFIRADIHGLIVESTKSALPNPNIDLYRQITEKGIPILFIHGCYYELDCSYAVVDDTQAGYLATKHLIDLGHKEIGGIFKIDDIQGHYRFRGFQKACHEAGIEIDDSNIIWFDTSDRKDSFSKFNGPMFAELLNRSSAIVCYNDQITIKVMDIIRGKGMSVPDDISLVSFDNSQLAVASEVKLTTVAHPQEKLGQVAAKTLIDMINNKTDHNTIKMEPELIVRGSAKKVTDE